MKRYKIKKKKNIDLIELYFQQIILLNHQTVQQKLRNFHQPEQFFSSIKSSATYTHKYFQVLDSDIIESNALEMHWTPRDGRVGRSVGRSGNFFWTNERRDFIFY